MLPRTPAAASGDTGTMKLLENLKAGNFGSRVRLTLRRLNPAVHSLQLPWTGCGPYWSQNENRNASNRYPGKGWEGGAEVITENAGSPLGLVDYDKCETHELTQLPELILNVRYWNSGRRSQIRPDHITPRVVTSNLGVRQLHASQHMLPP